MPVTPLQAATDVLDRADALLTLDAPPTPEAVRTDIRRLAWSMASASIDTSLHWRVHKVTLKSGVLPKKLRNLEVTFDELVQMGRSDVQARREGITNRPIVKARNVLHERILRDTYQSSSGVESALQMCGVTDIWGKLSVQMGETKREIMDHLNALAHRRNSIVHEGDIQRKSRPQNVTHQPLSRQEIDAELVWVRAFVTALSNIA